jgi:FkbM family methyltransferase
LAKLWTAQYDEDKWLAAQNDLPADGVFVEVGASTGLLHSNTYWLEQRGWRGLLVEADARNLDSVRRLRRVPVEHCAAAHFDGVTRFVQHRDVTLSGIQRADDEGTVVDVQARRLDTLLSAYKLGVPDLISIDTEGSELDVLDGMGELRPKYLIVEYVTVAENGLAAETDGTANKARLTVKLAELGYEVVHVTASNLIARHRYAGSAN